MNQQCNFYSMIFLLGIVGVAALFVLMSYSATRVGSRLGDSDTCPGEACTLESCSIHGSCAGCGEEKSASGWWPDDNVKDGDRR